MNTHTQQTIEHLMGTDVETPAPETAAAPPYGRGESPFIQHIDEFGYTREEALTKSVSPDVDASVNAMDHALKDVPMDGNYIDALAYESNPTGPGHDLLEKRFLEGQPADSGASEPPVEPSSGEFKTIAADSKQDIVRHVRVQNMASSPGKTTAPTPEQMAKMLERFPHLRKSFKRAMKKQRQAARSAQQPWRKP